MTMDSAIVDVGSSNVEEFFQLMGQYHGSHEEFDYFVVPVVKDYKKQADTINTIKTLAGLQIPPSKILLVMNRVLIDDDVSVEFEGIEALALTTKAFTFNKSAVIYANELFNDIKGMDMTIQKLLDDKTDWRAKLKEAKTPEDKNKAAQMISLKRLAITVNQNLDSVFEALFGKQKVKAAV